MFSLPVCDYLFSILPSGNQSHISPSSPLSPSSTSPRAPASQRPGPLSSQKWFHTFGCSSLHHHGIPSRSWIQIALTCAFYAFLGISVDGFPTSDPAIPPLRKIWVLPMSCTTHTTPVDTPFDVTVDASLVAALWIEECWVGQRVGSGVRCWSLVDLQYCVGFDRFPPSVFFPMIYVVYLTKLVNQMCGFSVYQEQEQIWAKTSWRWLLISF